MRTTLMIVAAVTIGGCAGTKTAQRPDAGPAAAAPTGRTPVVSEHPSLLDRQRISRQEEAARAGMADTEVSGAVTR